MANFNKVFVYGTLKKGFPNHRFLSEIEKSQTVRFLSDAETVEKYPLVTATEAGIPFLLDCPGHGMNVTGEVFEVCDRTLAHLDDLEDEGVFYSRIKIPVVLSDSNLNQQRIDAFAYLIKNYRKQLMDYTFISNFTLLLAEKYCPKTERTIDYQDIIRQVKNV